ncbi:MAG: transcriptional regulator TetR family [Firmicutes bacterium]|nr:transcriptional regulator TetR family [Bacillota bacterium]
MAISLLHRKESVVLTAIEIIDELGIQNFSTRELAKRQSISEGTLYKHFKSKNEIILAVLDYYSKFDLAIYEATLAYDARNNEPSNTMLHFWIDAYVTYYENYPAITALVQLYDVFSYDNDLREKVQEIYSKRSSYLKIIIETIQEKGEFPSTIKSTVLVDIVLGSFREICLSWRMAGRSFSLRDRMLTSLAIITDLFKVN